MNETWAVLELMGHVRTAGRVSEVELFGVKMGRIEIPNGDGWVTQFFGGSSVYRLTPCGEAEARAVAAANQPRPVHSWEMARDEVPRGLHESPHRYDDDSDDDDDLGGLGEETMRHDRDY